MGIIRDLSVVVSKNTDPCFAQVATQDTVGGVAVSGKQGDLLTG